MKQIGLFIGAFGGSETGEFAPLESLEAVGRQPDGFLPGRLPEMGKRIGGVQGFLGGLRFSDQGPGQPVWVADVIEAEAPFHTKLFLICRSVTPLDPDNPVFSYMKSELTPHSAERAQGVDPLVTVGRRDGLCGLGVAGQQGPGWTGLDAFTAGNAGAFVNGILLIEDDL